MSANTNFLVGYGSSSESDNNVEEEESGKNRYDSAEKREDEQSRTEVKIKNFLAESGPESSSDSEQSQEGQDDPEVSTEPKPSTVVVPALSSGHRLPPPPPSVLSDCSVFTNPFRDSATEKLSFLQKHVPLTLDTRPSHIGGRKMCISYRRDNRCRFGSSCKFAHDSDLQNPRGDHDPKHLGSMPMNSHQIPNEAKQDSVDSHGEVGRKRRVGLSDTLTPPKRALKQYESQRKKEGVTPFS